MKEKFQKFGRVLSAMVMPNIAVFIAWGIITALFTADGWFPNETLSALVDPMNKYLLPILIGYTGGYNVYKQRGAVVGSIMTMGVLVGAPIPMFIGAMVAGPFGGYVIKKLDEFLKDHIPQGFEMLANNFSAGILGFILAIIGCLAIHPACLFINDVLASGVNFFVNHGLLPILSIIIEPAKVLFLNNAVNHGIFSPLGVQEVLESGKSIFFLIESNPGPGLGILLAYCMYGKGGAKASAPGAAIIHFFGGIHEIYFPYILMNPMLILAVIAGGASGVLTNIIFDSGLVAPVSPGSIIAIVGMSAKGSHLGVIASIVVATAVSFVFGMFILKVFGKEGDLEEAKHQVSNMENSNPTPNPEQNKKLRKIVFACDAGMGSSAMGAALLTKKLKAAGIDIDVPHHAINDIPNDTEVVVTAESLVARVKEKFPNIVIFPIKNFMGGSEYDAIVEKLNDQRSKNILKEIKEPKNVTTTLSKDAILLNCKADASDDAIKAMGNLLFTNGYIDEPYIEGMLKRDHELTTYIGNDIAIPHGEYEVREYVKSTGLAVMIYPEGISWGGGNVRIVIGIAANGDDHMAILSNIALKLSEMDVVEKIVSAQDVDFIYDVLTKEE